MSAHYIALQPSIDPAFPDKSRDYWNDAAQAVIGANHQLHQNMWSHFRF